MKLGFIGGGTMAEAMMNGVLKSGAATPGDIVASDVIKERRDYLHATYGITVVSSNAEAVEGSELGVLAVKPQDMADVLAVLKGKLAANLVVVSIVAGATIKSITKGLQHQAVIRAMPNTPGQVGAGITVWTATPQVTEQQRQSAKSLLSALGEEVSVPDEKLIDMATALSASGPAYVFLFIEALIDAGVYLGMSRELAKQLVTQTVLGSSTMVRDLKAHPAQLRDMVTSPGGTTAEALLALEEGGFRATVMSAVIAAYEKAKEMGKET